MAGQVAALFSHAGSQSDVRKVLASDLARDQGRFDARLECREGR
jgi:hypothetical protein